MEKIMQIFSKSLSSNKSVQVRTFEQFCRDTDKFLLGSMIRRPILVLAAHSMWVSFSFRGQKKLNTIVCAYVQSSSSRHPKSLNITTGH